MNLYLDDMRPAPEGWTLVKNYDEAIRVLSAFVPERISLDHDLAYEHYAVSTGYSVAPHEPRERTGCDVALWIVKNNRWPTKSIACHSMNPVGRAAILALLRRYAPEGVEVVP